MAVRRRLLCLPVMVSCFPSIVAQPAHAQTLRPEVFISVGGASPFRIEDRGFGIHLNVGGGAGLRWRRLGLQFDANRTLGLSPQPATCGIVNPPCVGTARSGVARPRSAGVAAGAPLRSRRSVGCVW